MTAHNPPTPQPHILVERRDGVAIVTLNRPQERNPLGLGFPDEILAVLQDLEDDLGLHAVVLTGAGSVFCAGAELGKVVHPDGIDPPNRSHSATRAGVSTAASAGAAALPRNVTPRSAASASTAASVDGFRGT